LIFPLVIADASACSILSNNMKFNSLNGCGYCLNKGVAFEKSSGWVRGFPFLYSMPELRTPKNQHYDMQLQILD
jgi:hypothetical protein